MRAHDTRAHVRVHDTHVREPVITACPLQADAVICTLSAAPPPSGSGEPGAAAPPLVLLLSLPLALLAVSTLTHACRTAMAEPRLALPLLRNSVWLQLRLAAAAATLLALSAEHAAPSASPPRASPHAADCPAPPCRRFEIRIGRFGI